jgi:hypothetical protein
MWIDANPTTSKQGLNISVDSVDKYRRDRYEDGKGSDSYEMGISALTTFYLIKIRIRVRNFE